MYQFGEHPYQFFYFSKEVAKHWQEKCTNGITNDVQENVELEHRRGFGL
jgi:hypothetical protein